MKKINLAELEKDLAALDASRQTYVFEDACVTLSYDPNDLVLADNLFKETPTDENPVKNIR